MRIGLHALGIGTGARPEVIRAVAVAAEAAGFATLWSGEHAVMVDEPASRYPYSPDGQIGAGRRVQPARAAHGRVCRRDAHAVGR